MEKQTYIAFDAYALHDQVNSNWSNFRTLHAWQHSYQNRFSFNDLADIDFAMDHPAMIESTLRPYLTKKMEVADNLLVIASPVTDIKSGILNWQIHQAVNFYHLPVVVAYAGLSSIDSQRIDQYVCWLPEKLVQLIADGSAKVAHIPLTMDKVERACKNFSKQEFLYPWNGKTIY